MSGDDALDAMMQVLRAEYLAEAPARLAEFRTQLDAWEAGDAAACDRLHRLAHQMAGSAGSYGFADASTAARQMERLLQPAPTPDAALLAVLRAAVQFLETSFTNASA